MGLEKVIDDKNIDLLMKIDNEKLPKHIAIIMDGNGRWATKKGLPRSFGHKQGVSVLKKIAGFSVSFSFESLTILSLRFVFWDKEFLLKDDLFVPIEF